MRHPRLVSFALSSALAAGCAPTAQVGGLAAISPLGDSAVHGTAEFAQVTKGQVRIRVQLEGLTPGLHGIHIHQFGDCSAPDGSSVGEHFNPEHMSHGGPEGPKHHAGDLGNIEAGADGRATLTLSSDSIALDDGPHGVMGRSVVVHAMADDLVTDPAGASGAKIACGVIRAPTGTTKPVLPQS